MRQQRDTNPCPLKKEHYAEGMKTIAIRAGLFDSSKRSENTVSNIPQGNGGAELFYEGQENSSLAAWNVQGKDDQLVLYVDANFEPRSPSKR